MISRFSTLFAGHVDLGDMGREATPANDRRYSGEHLNTIYEKTEAIAKCLDENGYDIFWLAEHHFQHEGYECIPNLLMMGLHLAHLTDNIRIGCGFNITPMWHPLRLAEDYATVDILTKGRVVFGVGRGYHTREVETLGGPLLDAEANREIFEEQVEILFKAFNNESFSHQGKYFTLPPEVPYRGYDLKELSLVPRPVNLPVECWQPVVSATERGLDFMVKHAIRGLVGGGSALLAERPIVAYQEAWKRAGVEKRLGEGLALGVSFHLAPTAEQAIREARPYFEEHAKMFGPLGFIGPLSDEQLAALAGREGWVEAGVPTLERAVETGSWYCGPPQGFVEFLQGLEERYPGTEAVNVNNAVGTPQAVMLEQLEWFARDVMPAFRGRRQAAE